MKKTLYYAANLRRENKTKVFFLSIFWGLASYPRLLLEVFIRKDFGERYFKLSASLTIAIVLGLWPYLPSVLVPRAFGRESADIMPDYLLWYVFLAGFLFMSFRHYRDQLRNPSVFDFKKFSLYSGKINPFFFGLTFLGSKPSVRQVECWVEPICCFLVGIFCYAIGQKLGGLLMFCSIVYGGSYMAAYFIGDNFVMDKIDEIILNEELEKSFMDDKGEDETRGYRFVGRKPEDQELRRRVFDHMTEKDEVFQAK